MISYYGYTISPNQLETGEGFLICRNVPIARTGTQEYLGNEIGMETSEVIEVGRPEEEVFSSAAMASFEGKPVTNDHPTELVTPDNVARYEKGHVQNVRRGSGEFEDYLVADLHIHDAELINAIKSGKRQISCGYECEYVDKDGQITQSNIRGNHVAVVDEGRAGAKAAIMDSIKKQPEKAERNKSMSKKKSNILKLFGLALDAADALEEQAEVKAEETADEELTEKEQAKVETEVRDAVTMEEIEAKLDKLEEIPAKLDKLITLLTPKEPEKAEVEVETKEVDEAVKEQDETGEESVVVSAEEMDACGGKAMDRKNDLNKIMNAQGSYAAHKDTNEDIQARYAAMNPHNKKEVR